MDSLDMSRKFPVLAISRLFLYSSLGFSHEQVASLTDDEMFRIADTVEQFYLLREFAEHVQFITRTVLAEKQWTPGEHHG
jgi:hypothetical protein